MCLYLCLPHNIYLYIKKTMIDISASNYKHVHIDKTFQMRLCLVTFDPGCHIIWPYCLLSLSLLAVYFLA